MDAKDTTKQIFALRKEEKLEEALQLARPLYAAYPADPWVVGALGWVLYSCIRRDQAANLFEQARLYAEELKKLDISADSNEILRKQAEFVLKALSPEYMEQNTAKELSKSGKHAEAADILRKAVIKHPDCVETKTSLAWELYRLLHAETELGCSIVLMRDYCKLNLNTKSELLHSLFLSEACKRAEEWTDFNKFVKWWNIEQLMPSDWEDEHGKDGSGPYPSRAAKLATALYKNAKAYYKRGPEFQWMLPFVHKVATQTNSGWAPYYLAKMTVWFEGETAGVKELLVPIVKAKQREFWAWHILAECTLDTTEKKAFYARAVLSHAANEDFKVDLYHQFALFLAETEEYTLASLVVGRYITIQTKNEKPLAPDIVKLQQATWFNQHAKDDLSERLGPVAEDASDFLFKDQPWTAANFIEVLESNAGRPPLTILLLAEKGECKIKNRCAPSERPDRGAAIRVKLFWPPISTRPLNPGELPHRPPNGEIYAWEPRSDGTPYDCAKRYSFEGRIDIHDGNAFGFVKGSTDVFVSPSLVSKHQLVDGMTVKGWALYEWNDKKGQQGLSALTIGIKQESSS